MPINEANVTYGLLVVMKSSSLPSGDKMSEVKSAKKDGKKDDPSTQVSAYTRK